MSPGRRAAGVRFYNFTPYTAVLYEYTVYRTQYYTVRGRRGA
jgi:hypothetical protein